MENTLITDDEVGREIVQTQIESLTREMEGFLDNKKQLQEAIDNYKPQWEVDDELYKLMIAGQKKIEPQFEFERDPRYWELRTKQLESKYKMDKFMAESRLAEYDRQMKLLDEQIDSAKTKLKELGVEA